MGRSTETIVYIRASLPATVMLLLATACGTTEQSAKGEDVNLKEYEATFRPSDFDGPLAGLLPEGHNAATKDSATTALLPAQPPELTQGYRVQLVATTNYDDAMEVKAAAESQFPDEWFYIVYDPPTYKIRAGNFLERYEADRFAKQLAEKGYKDSWVVPEKVYSTPPPRPAPVPEAPTPPK